MENKLASGPDSLIRQHLVGALRGGQAFDRLESILAEVPVGKRFVALSSGGRSAWQIVEHMRLSLLDLAEYIDNESGDYKPLDWPDDYWPNSLGPSDNESWDDSVMGLLKARELVEDLIADPARNLTAPFPWHDSHTLLREALLAIEHTSYHCGEIVELTLAVQ